METTDLTYIRMVQTGDTGKTRIWEVRTKPQSPKDRQGEGGEYLGDVKWFGRWRGYAFFPAMDTIFEQKCLREIANFLVAAGVAHREALRAKKGK